MSSPEVSDWSQCLLLCRSFPPVSPSEWARTCWRIPVGKVRLHLICLTQYSLGTNLSVNDATAVRGTHLTIWFILPHLFFTSRSQQLEWTWVCCFINQLRYLIQVHTLVLKIFTKLSSTGRQVETVDLFSWSWPSSKRPHEFMNLRMIWINDNRFEFVRGPSVYS